jgi:alpha-ketoglutarate-dependent taurine dioxygenase
MARFILVADVSSDNLPAVRPVLERTVAGAVVTENAGGLHVEGVMDGADARDVNRQLLSALRRVEKKTRLRAEWTGGDVIHRFFDYVPKSTRPASADG